VSYSLIVTAKYQSEFSALPIWLQEETLDEIDKLLEFPAQTCPKSLEEVVFDFVRSSEGKTHYIFITLVPDHGDESVEMRSLGYFAK
jgi:hypothetical protein